MTIKKTWTATIPFVNKKIRREKILKPGHEEHIWFDISYDRELEQPHSTSGVHFILKVETPDRVVLTNTYNYKLLAGTKSPEPEVFEREHIEHGIRRHGRVIGSITNKEIDIYWESTSKSKERR